MTIISDRYKARPRNTPGTQEAEGDIQQLTITQENNTQGLREQMQNSHEVEVCTNILFNNLKIPIL